MEIKINDVDYELRDGILIPSRINFTIKGSYQLSLRLASNGSLYVNNGHILPSKRKGKIKAEDYANLENDRDFMSNPYLELMPSDLPFYEEVIEHWKSIRPRFAEQIAHGSAFAGHTSTTYIYPDGRRVRHPARKDPTRIIKGRPSDTRFVSDGCTYIEHHPLEQHYRHGRHDYYLEKSSVTIEDSKTIQSLESDQPEAVLELLKFVSSGKKPREALDSLARSLPKSRNVLNP